MDDAALRTVLERLTADDLVQATIRRGKESRVTVRPVEVRGERMVQVSAFDGRRTEVKNHPPEAFRAVAEGLLQGATSAHVGSAADETNLQITKKGRAILGTKRRAQAVEPALRHDRAIARPLPAGRPDPFLQAIGFMTADGRIKADRQRKYTQINEFIRVVEETGDLRRLGPEPLLIVDFGCGNAYLSFALHDYLNRRLGIAAELVGVDRQREIVERDRAKAAEIGAAGISFVESAIADYEAPRAADIVTALHACDTATDEALAKALAYRAKLVFAAPCCHHHCQVQIAARQGEAGHAAILRDGILRERLGDVVTDALRAMLLRIAGYDVDVIEFVAPEHTAKNLLIRAKRTGATPAPELVAEYAALKRTFGVTPYLEGLLPAEVRGRLNLSGSEAPAESKPR